jgi:hypothetical protein
VAASPTPGASNGAAFLTLPAITQQPQNTGGTAGSTVSLNIVANGAAPLSYQWRFNGVNIAAATNATLLLPNLGAANEGNYSVFVSNPAGSSLSATATLTVAGPPTITLQPQTQVSVPGASITFSVLATGGGLSYQWQFNGNDLAGATNTSLTLTNVQTTNAGGYSVVVANMFPPVTSDTAYLVMTPPGIAAQPQNQTNYTGTTASFSVIPSGDAPFSYQWRKNGSNLSTGTNNPLLLPNVQLSDAGNYSVVVFNPLGSVTSAVATLTAIVPLLISQQPTNLVADAGTNVTFSVTASGTGPLHYQWRFNGGDITSNPSATTSSLSLTNIQLTNNGTYSVKILDDVSTATSSNATLIVKLKPFITQHPTGLTLAAGSTASLNISAGGSLPLTFRWRRANLSLPNGIFTTNANTSFLTLTNVGATDASFYNVAITNFAGAAPGLSSNAFVTVVIPPTDQTVTTGSNATFSVSASSLARVLYQWRFNGSDLTGETNATLNLSNAQSANAGTYAVVVTTVTNAAVAPGTFSANLTVVTPSFLTQPQFVGAGAFRMLLQGNPGRSYDIEISSALTNWTRLATIVYTNGLMPFIDNTATNRQRFYRARLVP